MVFTPGFDIHFEIPKAPCDQSDRSGRWNAYSGQHDPLYIWVHGRSCHKRVLESMCVNLAKAAIVCVVGNIFSLSFGPLY